MNSSFLSEERKSTTYTLDDPAKSELWELSYAPSTFLDGLVIVYGARGSGKTTAVLNVMDSVKDEVEEVYIISQSAGANDQFGGFVPPRAIRTSMNKDWFNEMMIRQKTRSNIYHMTQDIKHLAGIFDIIATRRQKACRDQIMLSAEMFANKLEEKDLSAEYCRWEKMKIHDKMNKNLLALYQESIRSNTIGIDNKSFTASQRVIIENIGMRAPRALFVIDDCSSMFKEWCRQSKDILEAVYNGRHYFLTLVITAQDDSEVDLKIRKNATVSIFADATSATANFNRGERSKDDNKKARFVIEKIWRDKKEHNPGYRKLAFLSAPQDGDPFKYANFFRPIEPFKVGSPLFWELGEEAGKNKK